MIQSKKVNSIEPPIISVKLKKIGERHGDKIGDEFKPPNQKPKPRKVSKKKKKVIVKPKIVETKPKTKRNRKPRNPSPKTIEKRTAYSEKFKNGLREKATKAELSFKGNLDAYEIEYEFQKEVITRKSFIVADFYIPSLKLMVELDGGYHNDKEQKKKDRQKDIEYHNNGFNVLRMMNEQVNSFDFDQLKMSIDQETPTEYLKKMIY